jgi:hypothetical protein
MSILPYKLLINDPCAEKRFCGTIQISPTYRPSLVQQFGSFSLEASRPFAKSDLDPVPYQWNIHVAGTSIILMIINPNDLG